MSYYCHECAQRRDILSDPLSCAFCGSEMIDSIPIINEESSEEEELQEFFSEIDLYYNILAQEQAQDDTNFDDDDEGEDEEDDDEEALEERCLFEQLSSMYNHPIARNFTSTSASPFTALARSATTPTAYRRFADRLQAQQEEGEEQEEITEDEEDRDIVSYDIRFEQRTMNDDNELNPPEADGTWEASILPQAETDSLFQLPFARFGRLLDAMYNYQSDDESDEGESNYHRRSFLDNLADILSDYTSDVRQRQAPTTPASTVDAIVRSLKKSCLDSSDPVEISRHPADQEQEQSNQEMHEVQLNSTHSSAFTGRGVSLPSLPSSTSSTILEAGRLTFVELDRDRYETEIGQSEDVVYEGSQTNSEQSQDEPHYTDDDSFEAIVDNFERSISSALSPRNSFDANAVYEGFDPTTEQDLEEVNHVRIESNEESDGVFHRSISSILLPSMLDTIPLTYSTITRSSNRHVQPAVSTMDEYISDQFQANRPHIIPPLYDHNASDNTNANYSNSSMMDWSRSLRAHHKPEYEERYRKALEQFIRIVNDTTRHAYSFLKFIFLREFRNPRIDPLKYHLNKTFFQEVWLSRTAPSQRGERPPGQETRARRAMIAVHPKDYLNASGYHLPEFKYALQSAIHEAEKMYTAYIVSIKNTFGNQLRRVANSLLNVQERSKTLGFRAPLYESTTGVRITKQRLKTQTYEDITEPAKRFKD
ncbi:hypothetical protein [Parasitella parasitica]|uniref:Uncharacterized protein n=1 Tax=Parasitella parasitica TaxID=35722 RepID=A0A0B7NGG3_9FUNG|nr:hypothetical protein [Parasitella parasitica]